MVIMALDHVRDYFSNQHFAPEDLSHTFGTLFFTRVITHYCAPVFFLLAGTGAYLAISRGKSVQQVSRFFWTRGLWLVFLELTVLRFGWNFTFARFSLMQVIWALGWSMVVMAAIVRLPVRWIAALGISMIVLHNLLDGITPASFGKLSWLWIVLHASGVISITPKFVLLIGYPLVPWIGVMAVGYALGALLLRQDHRKLVLRLGIGLTLAFFVVRGFNHYGNSFAGAPGLIPSSVGPWTVQPTLSLTIISFFDTLKYPPSLDYLLMTLGPALIVLAWFDGMKAERGLGRIFLVYGRVPLFYYVLHVYLIHAMAILVGLFYHQPVAWLWNGGFIIQPAPDGYGHGLPFVYLVWIIAVVLLYFPSEWFMEFKSRHRNWNWLSYV
jgi:uncharacterized membrane protein